MTAPVIVWLRRDLRLADQPALAAAVANGAARKALDQDVYLVHVVFA